MDPILLRTQLLFCRKYKTKLTLNSKNVKQLITTAIISIEMFLSRECEWLIYTQNKTTKNGCHPGSYFTHLFGLELYLSPFFSSLTNQPTFWDATTGFPTKWCLGNEHKMSILMTHHYPDQGSASRWLKIYFIHSEAVPRSAGFRGFIKVFNRRATKFDTRAKNWQGPWALPPRGVRGHAPTENFQIL